MQAQGNLPHDMSDGVVCGLAKGADGKERVMEYRFSKDPLFGKYCYIDTPWIAGKNTIYRIINSGVRSNAWVEVPISGREEVVLHDHQEDVVFVVLDTLISEDSRIKKVALKDVKVADTFRECPWCKAVCASTDKYCHECGWHIADTPQTEEFKNFDREDLILLIECQKERIGELLADKDTPQTERIKTPDYCDICNHKGCGNCTANNLDDYCVPSGYEPTTQTETQISNLTFEKQTDCAWK